MPITSATFLFLSSNHAIKHKIFVVRITGNANPINEKIEVRCGDTYHANGDSKSRNIDTMVTVRKSSLIIFLIIALWWLFPLFISCQHQIADAFLLPLGCYIQIVLVCQVLHLSSWILLFFYNCSRNLFRLF